MWLQSARCQFLRASLMFLCPLGERLGEGELRKTYLTSPHTQGPLRREAGERKGPIAKQWVGEVVADKHGIFLVWAPWPTSPSPHFARVPSLSPRDDAGGEGV